jgi:hypothetical protein
MVANTLVGIHLCVCIYRQTSEMDAATVFAVRRRRLRGYCWLPVLRYTDHNYIDPSYIYYNQIN